MFTGIISAVGKVVKYDRSRLAIRHRYRRIILGESICVEGVCLTVARQSGQVAFFDVGPETQRITTLGDLKRGSSVNLERALRVGDRVGGHWVTGHVEDTGIIEKIDVSGSNRWFYIQVPASIARFVIPKGSIAVDGISLTVASIAKNRMQIMVIPHTLSKTTLGRKKAGAPVNLEADVLAKYALSTKP